MRYRLFFLLSSLVLCFSLAAPSLAATAPLHSFDAAIARPAELARETQASSPGALFRITGLRGADGGAITLDLETARLILKPRPD